MINNNTQKLISIASIAAPKLHLWSIENDQKNIYVFDAHVIRLLSKIFRIPYKILIPFDGEFGTKLPNGNWTGRMGMVQRSEVDLGPATVINYPRFQAVNFSYPYFFSDITFMTDKPKSVPTNLAILNPFPLILWILLIATIFFFSCVLFLHVYRKETYENVLFMLFGSLLEKSIGMQLRKCSPKLILSTWFIFAFVIIYNYKAVLLSILTLPRYTGIRNIQDFAEAAEQNSLTCYSFKGAAVQQILLESEFAIWRSIGQCLERNVINSEDAQEAFFKAPPNKAFITARSFLRPYEEMYFISEDSFYNVMHAFAVSKNFCCQSYLNEKIHRLFAAGLFQKIDKDEQHILKLKTTYYDSSDSGRFKLLRLEDLKGAFIVLFVGYALSTIALIIEISVKHYFPKSNESKICKKNVK